MSRTLYILYNADASLMGKLSYGYRKITCPKDATPECAACDITHGGLSLKETPAWVDAKRQIESQGSLKIVQWHRDELSSQVKTHVERSDIKYPVALVEANGELDVVMDKAELAGCNGDAQMFIDKLKEKGVLKEASSL